MTSFYGYSALSASIVTLTIGLIVFLSSPGNKTLQLFFLINIPVSIWCLSSYIFSFTQDLTLAIFFNWASYFSGAFIPVFFLHFVYSMIGIKRPKLLAFSYIATMITAVLSLTQIAPDIMAPRPPLYNFLPQPNLGYHFFVVFFVSILVLAYIELLFAYKNIKGRHFYKNQLLYIICGSAIGFCGTIDFFLTVYNTPLRLPFPHDFLIITYTLIFAYAILRHHLLDIKLIIKKTVFYSLLTALLTGIFLSAIIISDYWLRLKIGYSSVWGSVVTAFVVALLFQPLRGLLERLVDRYFFRARYEYQDILNKYSHTLARPMADLNRFARLAPYLLWKSLKLSGASFMTFDRNSRQYLVRAAMGSDEKALGRLLPENSALISQLSASLKEVNLEDVHYSLKTDHGLAPEARARLEAVAAEMEGLGAVLVIPAVSESEYFNQATLLATINLGPKLSDEAYSREDVEFLKTLANQATISIEYAFILEELKKNQEQMVKSEKLASLGTAVAGIAHELKNPLTYLMVISQAMAGSWDNPSFKESVVKIFPSEVERMKLIIDGLSDYSKVKELRIEPVELTETLDKTLAILGYEIKRSNALIVKNYPAEGEPRPVALADKNRIIQVFMNIIANGLQAMAEKGGDLSLTVRRRENEVCVSVSDSGPGIPEEKLNKIFDPFYTTKAGGTGLGLPITKKIVDEHRGSIYIDSHPGEGTTFTICLPAAST